MMMMAWQIIGVSWHVARQQRRQYKKRDGNLNLIHGSVAKSVAIVISMKEAAYG